MVQDSHKGERETVSPCDCHSGGYCLLVSPLRGAGSGNGAYTRLEKEIFGRYSEAELPVLCGSVRGVQENGQDRNGQAGKATGNQEGV